MPKSWAFRTRPPSYRRRIVTPYPDTRPVPTLHRLSGPRSRTQGGAATTTTNTPTPSFRTPIRNPRERRGYPPTVIPHQHPLPPYRRAGVGRYPGDGRGYPDKHPKNQTAHTHSTVVPGSDLTPPRTTHQHPPTIPPSFWPPSVIPAPDPEPKGAARKPPQPSSPTNTPSPLTVVPA